MAEATVSYTCPNCNAPLAFHVGADKVTCDYCGSQFETATIETLFAQKEAAAAREASTREARWKTEMAGSEFTAEEVAALHAFTCSSCGAELVCDTNTMATECCYCGNPTMLPSRFSGMLKPDFVIPFKKTKAEAVAALQEFYKGKKLLPDAFTQNNRVEDIQPMYVPFWLFDAAVTLHATFSAEKDVVTTSGKQTITETSYYEVEREGSMNFSHIPVDGSREMDNDYMESIEPFDYSEMAPFSSAYLTGFLANKYDEDAQACAPRADDRLTHSAMSVLEDTVKGYTRVTQNHYEMYKHDACVSYALVPVWILTTRYEDKPYTFMMNGQTGKFIGSLPWDKGKAQKYQLMAFAPVAAVVFAVAYFVLQSL